MTAPEVLELLAKVAGPISLLIISIPKLAELVIGRSISLSIEREKARLQADLERHKLELASQLEQFKSSLQRDIIEDQRQYQDRLSTRTAMAVSAEKAYLALLVKISGAIDLRHCTPQEIYGVCTAILEEAFGAETYIVKPLELTLKELDVFVESAGALQRPEFAVSIQALLDAIAIATRNEITKLRGKVNEN